jgi:GT2 family glycosyltransferase
MSTGGTETDGMNPDGAARGDDAAEWHRIAEERRQQLERLQQRRLYAVAARWFDLARRWTVGLRRLADPPRTAVLLLARSLRAVPRRATAAARERALRAALRALPAPAAGPGAPAAGDVTAVIVTAAQPRRLDVLLGALDRVGIAAIVVDNAGAPEVAEVVARHPRATRLRLDVPSSYATANTVALDAVATPWALLLNDDVAPLEDGWFARLAATAAPTDAPPAAAVGAVLVHGRRGLLGGPAVDLTVQHAGIGPVLDGPLVRVEHLGRGDMPVPRPGARDVLAATAACLLVDVAVVRAVGGLHEGFDYGMEDVDLCLRLGARGPVRIATDAVLLHEEGATRLRGDRRARTARQRANRRLLDSRRAPALRARVVRSALGAVDDPVARPVVAPVVAVADGAVPPALAAVPGLRVLPARAARGGPRPALLVRAGAPARVQEDAPRPPVPVVGWPGTAAAAAAWSDEALESCDLLVTTDGDPCGTLAARVPTLPVRRLPEGASIADVTALVADALLRPRWSVRTGAPAGRAAARWGDTPVAAALCRELRALGVVARTAPRPAWGGEADRAADVALHLKGRGVAPAHPGQRTLVWLISHPSELAPGELDAADLVLAASASLAEHLRARTSAPVHVLHQAADDRTFVPGPVDPGRATRVLFLGNTRSVARPAVMAAVRAGLPLTLVGAGWHRFVDPGLVARASVPPADLPAWYRSAEVVLNDHWDDMRRWGLVSNRVFEVLACGGCVVSDAVPGLDELLDGAVPMFRDAAGLAATVTALLADPARRAELAGRGRAAVLAAHTWRHRAEALRDLVAALPPAAGAAGTAG